MREENGIRGLLAAHCNRYPKLQIEDIFKFLFQSAFGCEHMVSSADAAVERIKHEHQHQALMQERAWEIEPLDGAYCRVPLSCLNDGPTPETLGVLFCRSAKPEADGERRLTEMLEQTRAMIDAGLLPFDPDEFERKCNQWCEEGYPALHHSEAFRQAYHPSYRVLAKEYAIFLPLFSQIDRLLKKGSAVIAIEGGSASGKSTLAQLLKEIYSCTVFHMDDFFLQPFQRTAERLAEVGGNLDRERFLEEVLTPLRLEKPIAYRRFDCSKQSLEPPVAVAPERLTVVEGVYSMHPDLASDYDLSVYLDIDANYQRERILKRNTPAFAEIFFSRWIPMENTYFEGMAVKERCNLSVAIDRNGFEH